VVNPGLICHTVGMTDPDTTPTAQERPVQRLAVVALIAGLTALVLLGTLRGTEIGWTAVSAITALTAGIVSVVDATRAGRDASWLAIIGAITGLVTLIMVTLSIM